MTRPVARLVLVYAAIVRIDSGKTSSLQGEVAPTELPPTAKGTWQIRDNNKKEIQYASKVAQAVSATSNSKSARHLLRALLCAVVLASPVFALGQVKPHKHSLTVKFNYDFGLTPACSAGAKKNCVQEFVVYDLSSGAANRQRLASKPATPGASGKVMGITITSPRLPFEIGKHFIAVVARTPDGVESEVNKCTIWVNFQ
jgi:hypothetical protein